MSALDMAIEAANRDWTNHARPIALAVIAMDAPAALYRSVTDNHRGDAAKLRDYREARDLFSNGRVQLLEMMDGIRDNYRCDHFRSYPRDLSTISEDEADEIERFNEALDAGIMSVDAFMMEVENEV